MISRDRLLLLVGKSVGLVVNGFFDQWVGGKDRPLTFDISKTAPALQNLALHHDVILGELQAVLQSERKMPTYEALDSNQRKISAAGPVGSAWRVFLLYAMGEKPALNREQCPQTSALLDQIPGLFQAFFSVLDPEKPVSSHHGPFRGYLRYHLGLIIPDQNPPSIRIRNHLHTWKVGEAILFDDSWDHEVINACKERRCILIVDILRPMPSVPTWVNELLTRAIQKLYAKRMIQRIYS